MFTDMACPAELVPRHRLVPPTSPTVSGLIVRLVPSDPGLVPLRAPADPVSQCDCACYTVEGEGIPVLEAPVSFYLELTPVCHNRCPGCGNVFVNAGSGRAVPEFSPPLTADDWAQILDEVRPHVHRIKLTGGEPTSHPQFRDIARRAADLGVPFTLFTHGHWHQPQRMIRFLADLPAFDGLLVSLHGPDPARHEAFTRTPGSFVRVLATVQAAAEAGLHISLSCVLTHHNWNRVAAMPSLARRIGAHEIVFNRYIGPAISGLTASRQELQAALHEVGRARARGEPVKFGNCVPTCFQPTGQAACLAGRAFLTIDPWGRARPCNHARLVCGNLLHQSLEDIWSSPGLNLWRGWEPTQCKACAAFSACRGGCQAQARALGLEADPLTGTPFPLADEPHTNELILFERARPVGRFSRQPQAFGSLLLAGNRLFPVGREMQGVLDTLDGSRTLEEIGAFHGPRGLGLVGSLYQAGMVELLA